MAEAWPVIVARYHLGKSSKLAEIVRFFRKNSETFSQALDIGTGTGALALGYKKYATSWDYLEIDHQAANQATKLLGQQVYTNWSEVEHNHYDLITVVDTFFYFTEPKEVVKKLEAMLNPGGKLLVTLTNGANDLLVNRLRDYLNLGSKMRGFAFEENKEHFLQHFSSSIWQSVYFRDFSYLFEEVILLILDWLDKKSNRSKENKAGVDRLTNIVETKNWHLWFLRLAWWPLKLASLLDYPFRGFFRGYRFVVVLIKKETIA